MLHQQRVARVVRQPVRALCTAAVHALMWQGTSCVSAAVALANSSTVNATCLNDAYWSQQLGVTILYNATQTDPACNNSSTCWKLLDRAVNSPCSVGLCSYQGLCALQDTGTATALCVPSRPSLFVMHVYNYFYFLMLRINFISLFPLLAILTRQFAAGRVF